MEDEDAALCRTADERGCLDVGRSLAKPSASQRAHGEL